MKKEFLDTIKYANSRGVGQFHVFCDQPFYTGTPLKHTGKDIYSSTWRSFDSACFTASKEDNGKVYNSSGKLVWPAT